MQRKCIGCGYFNEDCLCVLCNCCLEYSNSYFKCLQCNEEICFLCKYNHQEEEEAKQQDQFEEEEEANQEDQLEEEEEVNQVEQLEEKEETN
jgi:hypothetical protein